MKKSKLFVAEIDSTYNPHAKEFKCTWGKRERIYIYASSFEAVSVLFKKHGVQLFKLECLGNVYST